MEKFDIYKDISSRTEGDIYIGVVGPVRTGKSTFISKFVEKLVLPNVNGKFQKQLAKDEMPQSASGKGIMTTQPKFIPANSVKIQFKNKSSANFRIVDCVGYLVEGATGHIEEDKERLVSTPWDENPIAFSKAAEIGTKKVINDYSTIGILVTTDGSFGEIERGSYAPVEERIVNELKQLNKPFIILLNSSHPNSKECQILTGELQEKFGVSVVPCDVTTLTSDDIEGILEKVLLEFPVQSFNVALPEWLRCLPSTSTIISEVLTSLRSYSNNLIKMKDYGEMLLALSDSDSFYPIEVSELKLGSGVLEYVLKPKDGLFYKVLSDVCNEEISSEHQLMRYISEFAENKRKFSKIKGALESAEQFGYGVVYPTISEMNLEDPELVKQGGRFGVKLKASAPSFHIMKVDVETEVAPIVGTEKQGEDLVNYIMDKFENNPSGIWETNLLGRSLNDIVNEGLNGKLSSLPEDTQVKMRKTLSRIINENRGGLICILL